MAVCSFSSFIESRGQTLIDLSLYVSSQNYNGNTSPAYGNLLQWPNQWIFPPKLHAAARTRTEHLGFSSLDVQALEEQRQRDHSAAVASGQVPKNLIPKPRDTVSTLLGRSAKKDGFRIDALTSEFFEPLEAMLGQKPFLLAVDVTDTPTSLDCIALGYLSLAFIPDLSFPWLRDAMRAKAPLLSAYTERLRERCFGKELIETAHAFAPQPGSTSPLPWRAPGRISVAAVGSTLLSTLADSTPFLREIRGNNRLRKAAESDSDLSEQEKEAVSKYAESQKKDMYLSIATVVAGTAALVGYMVHTGLLQFSLGGEEEEESVEDDSAYANVEATDFLSSANLPQI